MIGLYVSSVVLAICKTIAVFQSDIPEGVLGYLRPITFVPLDWISTALLLVLVISAATTSSVISRNERSLLHSYHAQERRIRTWLENFPGARFISQENDPAVSASDDRFARYIIAFEEIMINELLDFIHITLRDVIETPGS